VPVSAGSECPFKKEDPGEIMSATRIKTIIIFVLCLMVMYGKCGKNPVDNETETGDSPPVLSVPYLDETDVTYIQPYGVPLDFGNGDIRPHMAVDFGCNDGVEFKASASGTLGNIWLEYTHSYQFNIIIDDKYIVHYCIEPIHIAALSDSEKIAAIYFSPGEKIEKDQIICKMVGGGGHLDWGLIFNDERICPACYLSDEDYTRTNTLFKSQGAVFEGYDNLCPENTYHANPRQ
jgi:hypothetical protein